MQWIANLDFFDDTEIKTFITNYERSLKTMTVTQDYATQVKTVYDQLRTNLNGAQLAALSKMILDNLSDPAMTENKDSLEARKEYIKQVDNSF
jgi:hypothetical protein